MMPAFSILSADTIFGHNMLNLRQSESRLLDYADQGQYCAVIHEPEDGIVVPRSYQRSPHFVQACADLAERGLRVSLRLSGGGVVPQARGVINLHLAYPVDTDHPMRVAEDHYRRLCRIIADTLVRYHIRASCQNVQGSFCDGRFNLAVNGRKIAGTAQYWRRNRAVGSRFSVLSHAVILVNACPLELTAKANQFEAALRSTIRYDAQRTTSVVELLSAPATGFCRQLHHGLAGWHT